MRKISTLLVGVMIALAAAAVPARADAVPDKIKIVVPFPAGGTTDILARHVAKYLEDKLGVQTIVENRAGASGTIGSDFVAHAPADGSVLLLTATHHVINPGLFRNLPYDTAKAFSPIAQVATSANALVVTKDFPAKSVAELIAMAKQEPGKLSFGSTGIGGANHLSGELFKQMAGIDMVHIPYKGAAPAMNDLIGGHIPVLFDSLPTVIPAAQGGLIRVLAVTSRERAPTLPDVPTLDEAGVKGFEAVSWFGLYMPQANNNAAYQKLTATVAEILAAPETAERFAAQGVQPGKLSGESFGKFVEEEIARWREVIRTAKVPQQD